MLSLIESHHTTVCLKAPLDTAMSKSRKPYHPFNPEPKSKKQVGVRSAKEFKDAQRCYSDIYDYAYIFRGRTARSMQGQANLRKHQNEIKPLTNLPEHGLLYGILTRALGDLAANTQTKPHIQRSAIAWFLSKKEFPFTFIWLAEHLNLTDVFVKRVRQLAKDVSDGKMVISNLESLQGL